jgi:hypothetical protein
VAERRAGRLVLRGGRRKLPVEQTFYCVVLVTDEVIVTLY